MWCLTTWSVNTSIPWHISPQAHQFEKPLYRVVLSIGENFFTRTLRYEKSYLSFLKFSMTVWGRPEPIYSPSSTFFYFKKYFCPLSVSFRKVFINFSVNFWLILSLLNSLSDFNTRKNNFFSNLIHFLSDYKIFLNYLILSEIISNL